MPEPCLQVCYVQSMQADKTSLLYEPLLLQRSIFFKNRTTDEVFFGGPHFEEFFENGSLEKSSKLPDRKTPLKLRCLDSVIQNLQDECHFEIDIGPQQSVYLGN